MVLRIPVHNQRKLPCTSFAQTFTTSSPYILCTDQLLAQRTYSTEVSYKLALQNVCNSENRKKGGYAEDISNLKCCRQNDLSMIHLIDCAS